MDNTAQSNSNDDSTRTNILSNQGQVADQGAAMPAGSSKESEPIARIESADSEKAPVIPTELERHVEKSQESEDVNKLPEGLSKSPSEMSINDSPVPTPTVSDPVKKDYDLVQIESAKKMKTNRSIRWKLIQFGRYLKKKALMK